MDTESAKGVFVFAEQVDGALAKVSLEILGKARVIAGDLKSEVTAVLLGNGVAHLADELIHRGADRVVLIESECLQDYTTEPFTHAIAEVIHRYRPEVFLYGATSIGRDLAPRVSARIRTGLTADCTSLDVDEAKGLLRMTRPAFGGNLMATIVCPQHRPQMATVRQGVMEALPLDPSRKGTVEPMSLNFDSSSLDVAIIEVIKNAVQTSDISEASIVVAGGRGVGSRENFKLVESLASILNGAVAASRPCVESGWAPASAQVGQTGKTVRPKLYVALGISGAIQHLAGMDRSGFIVAINSDPAAPIFTVADLGIVGDLNQVVPALIRQLKVELNK